MKFGKITYKVVLTKTVEPSIYHKYGKKGTVFTPDGIANTDGKPYWIAGHGVDIGLPDGTYKVIIVQNQIPDELVKRMTLVKRTLSTLIRNKSEYYTDAFLQKEVEKFVSEITERLKLLKNTKGAKRC